MREGDSEFGTQIAQPMRELETARAQLAESQRQQAALREVLRIISTSASDVQPVFQSIVESAARLCEAEICFLDRFDGQLLHFVAGFGLTPAAVEAINQTFPMPPGPGSTAARAIASKTVVQLPDLQTAPAGYSGQSIVEALNVQSALAVPMLKDGVPIGVITLDRSEAGYFPEHQVELLKTFADQAVIAIENARLFGEVELHRCEAVEALEQQRATSEVLRVIASSPTDIKPVLDSVVASAAKLCDAYDAIIALREGDSLAIGAHFGPIPVDFSISPLSRNWVAGRSVLDCTTVQVADLTEAGDEFALGRAMALRLGHRTILATPLIRKGEAIGTLILRRRQVRPFSDKQIELLKTFADQAVIAIQNVRLFDEVQARSAELRESLKQQTATADVLKVISRSTFDLQAVLDALAESVARLCEADTSAIAIRQANGEYVEVANFEYSAAARSYMKDYLYRPERGTCVGRVLLEGRTIQIPDVLADSEYTLFKEHGGPEFRTVLGVPMLRESVTVGVFVLTRTVAKAFSRKQIELVETFADQAVIAIENVRLFEEVQARNREVTEALDRQTATGEILRVIAASPTDIQPVLGVVVESAARFCDTYDAVLFLVQNGMLIQKAHYGPIPVDVPELPPTRDWVTGRCVADRETVHLNDAKASGTDFPVSQSMAERFGHRTMLATPLMREHEAIGALVIRRNEVRPFSDKQIDLLKTFADQAAIAIQNVRLFEEVQARNREVTEALEQQTATAEVLKTISNSAFDLDAVLHTLVKSASGLCHAAMGCIYLRDGDVFRPAMQVGWTQEFNEYMSQHPMRPGRGSVTSRAALTASIVHIPDALDDPEYTFTGGTQIGGVRTLLGVPLIRDGSVMGVFSLARPTVKPFSQREIELVQTFSDQALIALENVRLFEEVQARNREVTEALEQQTATGEVLRVIAASPTEIKPVLDTVVASAAKLCEAYDAVLLLRNGDSLVLGAHFGPIPVEFATWPLERDWVVGRSVIDHTTIHVPDMTSAGDEFASGRAIAVRLGLRTMLATPLLRKGEAIGTLVLRRTQVSPFSDKQVNLLKTFADQAVIAIENVRLFDEVQARNREVTEALERQTATGAILRVIAASPTDIQPVLQVVAESAARFCDTCDAGIFLARDGMLVPEAHYGPIAFDFAPMPVARDWVSGRAFADRQTLHVNDIMAAGAEFPVSQSLAERLGQRTMLATPLMRDNEAIGALVIRRIEVRPFSEKQIELVKTFADQAVIAIENVRLFDEVQARTAELSESLQQQTATADVLKAISRSTFDLRAVLDALAESVTRLCEADNASIVRETNGEFVEVASYGYSPELREYFRGFVHVPGRGTAVGRVLVEGKTVQIPDVLADADYTLLEGQRLGGYRTVLTVPLLREGLPVGVFSLTRSTVRPFTERQIELVETFADQAVIAIENVRLFDEVQARTRDLGEALEQQTATADVLKAISRSTFDLQPVLDTLVESAVKLCDADTGVILKRDGDLYRWSANYGNPPEAEAFAKANPFAAGRDSVTGRVALEARTIHVSDVLADPEYGATQLQKLGGYRTILCVPILREGTPVGVFALTRSEVRDFTPRQIELVETFADQSGIAIENVRLFDELQVRTTELGEALQQQTATADVLKVISRSTFDLPTVFDRLIHSAATLCGANYGGIFMRRGEVLRAVASVGASPQDVDDLMGQAIAINRKTVSGRVIMSGHAEHIRDILADPEYDAALLRFSNTRALMGVPLLRDGQVDGVFFLGRPEPGAFSARQAEVVQTFADQAVIAIENVRLFTELEEALKQQTATADVLKVISRSAFDLQAVLGTLTDSAARLCNAKTSGIFMRDGEVFRLEASYSQTPEHIEYEKTHPSPLSRRSWIGRCAIEKAIVHVPDVSQDLEHGMPDAPRIGGYKAVLCVPLMREGSVLGVFGMTRPEVGPFTERQIELIRTFADQAVIAIENVRLFKEVEDRTEELSRSLEDLRTAQDRLIQTEKLASLGQLTAGIAHEIKNPLNFVNNFSALSSDLIDDLQGVLTQAPLDQSVREEVAELTGLLKGNLDKVVQHGKRADSIVRNMLLHSRAGSGEHRPIDINAVVEESLNLAYHGARAERPGFNVTLMRDFDPQAGDVDLYPQEITRVLLNLISNGFYATIKRGVAANGVAYEPTLSASTRDLGDRVEIRIRDNGTGISQEVKEKMFNPFFTTKPAGEGTGLGLSLSHDIIVKQHAGTIDVDTKPGEFTEFRIVLPRGAASLAKSGGEA